MLVLFSAFLGLVVGLGLTLVYWASFAKYRKMIIDVKAALDGKADAAVVATLLNPLSGPQQLVSTNTTQSDKAAEPTNGEIMDFLKDIYSQLVSNASTASANTASADALAKQVKSLDEDINSAFRSVNTLSANQEKQVQRLDMERKADARSFNKQIGRLRNQVRQLAAAIDGVARVVGPLVQAGRASADAAPPRPAAAAQAAAAQAAAAQVPVRPPLPANGN